MPMIRRLIWLTLWRMTDYRIYPTGTANRTGYVGYYHLRGFRVARIRKGGGLDFEWRQ